MPSYSTSQEQGGKVNEEIFSVLLVYLIAVGFLFAATGVHVKRHGTAKPGGTFIIGAWEIQRHLTMTGHRKPVQQILGFILATLNRIR